MPSHWSIRRYLVALVLAIALPFTGLMASSLWKDYRGAVAEHELFARQQAEIVAADVGRVVHDARAFLRQLAARPRIRALDARQCDPVLAEIKGFYSYLTNVALANKEGEILCSVLQPGGNPPRVSVADAQWFYDIRASNQFVAGQPHVGPISGKWVSVLAEPIPDLRGEFGGLVGFPLDLAGFAVVPAGRVLPAGTIVTVVNAKGVVLMRSETPLNWIGKPLDDHGLLAFATGGQARGALLADSHPARFVGYSPVSGTDWRVVVEAPATSLLDDIWRKVWQGGVLAAALVLGGAALAFYIGSYIVLPVSRIALAARKVADGDLSERAVPGGPSEIEAVAGHFNRMLDVRLKAEHQYRALLESASDAIVVVDARHQIIIANRQAELCFGWTREEMLGKSITMLIPMDYRATHGSDVAHYMKTPQRRDMGKVVEGLRKDGTVFPADVSLSPMETDDGIIVSAFVRDLSDRFRYEEQLAYLSQYDSLTGLPNRALLHDRLVQSIGRAEREGEVFALLMIDVDGFKEINDIYGPSAGDAVLREVAERIRSSLRENDTLARVGSDDFVLIVENVHDENPALAMVDRINMAMQPPIRVGGNELSISVGIGVTIFPSDGRDEETLLKSADLALVQARKDGRGGARFFEAGMDERAMERQRLLSRLRGALDRHELQLHYQPKIDLQTGNIIGAEALLRWNNPDLGMVSPAVFIPLAEESGLIDLIGDWVLQTACHAAARWQRDGAPSLQVAVNLSARQFRSSMLVERVRQILAETRLSPSLLELEITESMLMHDPQAATAMLAELHGLGVQIAIDDFGTGYSSLAYLKRFPVHTLKIDRSFVSEAPDNADDVAIVAAVVSLAHSMRLGVVAEGVETEEQRVFLAELGCAMAQGYLFSRPLPEAQFVHLLEKVAA